MNNQILLDRNKKKSIQDLLGGEKFSKIIRIKKSSTQDAPDVILVSKLSYVYSKKWIKIELKCEFKCEESDKTVRWP